MSPARALWYDSPMQERLSRPVPQLVKRPETRLLAAYLADKFPDRIVMTRVPLGPPLPQGIVQRAGDGRVTASRGWRPEVDALVLLADPKQIELRPLGSAMMVMSAPAEGVILLIEAKVRELLNGLAKLPFYKHMLRTAPEFAELAGWEVRMRLVTPQLADWLEPAAQAAGIEIDYYSTPEIREYLEWWQHYTSQPYRMERQRVIEARRRLGL